MAELEDGIVLARVNVHDLREQDINARTMEDDKFNQLVANISKRGTLEQLPYCALTDRGVEIVSGHHRAKAAKLAGVENIEVLLDTNEMTRSAIAAKQLAHNAIEGTDDPKVLKAIAMLITDVDDMLESAIDPEIFNEVAGQSVSIPSVKVKFEWKTVQFTFLPEQLENLKRLCDEVDKADFEGVANVADFDQFAKALDATKKFADTRNISSTVSVMTKAALEKFGIEDESQSLVSVFGHGAIPAGRAEQVKALIDAMIEHGDISEPWEVFDFMAERMSEIANG